MNSTFTVFPKFYQGMAADEMARRVREAGMDAVNAVVREGYWCEPDNLADTLPAYCTAVRDEGLQVVLASTGFRADHLTEDETPLAVLAECGVPAFRMGYFRLPDAGDVWPALAAARRDMETMAGLCEKHGLRAVYQVHQNTLVSSASAVLELVCDLDPRHVGVMLDPGNQAHEGFESWRRSAPLLGPYLAGIGVKDVTFERDPDRAREPDKGWRGRWAPLDEGVVNWHDVIRALAAAPFAGLFVFMPFCHEGDPAATNRQLTRDAAYLRGVLETVETEREGAAP